MEEIKNAIFHFEDLVRCYSVLLDNTRECEQAFLRYVSNQELIRFKNIENIGEYERLKTALDAANKNKEILNSKLFSTRRWIDAEMQQRKSVEAERDTYLICLENIRRIIQNDPKYTVTEKIKERVEFIEKFKYDVESKYCDIANDRLNIINKLESTCINLHNTSVSRFEDDLNERDSATKLRQSNTEEQPETIKTKFLDNTSVVNFTPTAPNADLIESLLKSETPIIKENREHLDNNFVTPGALARLNNRTHNFINKHLLMSAETCLACKNKIPFVAKYLKCTNCNATLHFNCRNKVSLPCIPMSRTILKSNTINTLADYAPLIPPMIPAMVVHCVNEVEQRGLEEIGIYRIPGADRDVHGLNEKFLKCKGIPELTEVDIHAICSYLKDFLRNLQDPLIPQLMRNNFADAIKDKEKKQEKLCEAISSLPQPNRDTLSYIILHLKHVACSSACKMPITNLASIFGPIIVGYSNYRQVNTSTRCIVDTIMEELLLLTANYWYDFIIESTVTPKTPRNLRNTPTTENLKKKTSRKFL